MSKLQKPKTFEDAELLLDHKDLPVLLKAQLILIALGNKDATAFRAIEYLLAMPRDVDEDELDDLPDEELAEMLKEIEQIYDRYTSNVDF